MKLIILSEKFYKIYGSKKEILKKENRPYICLSVQIDQKTFAIPIRHNIGHPFCFSTLKPAGLDYTKAVVIEDQSYISPDKPWIDSKEWNIIKKNENKIFYQFRKYVRQYKRALKHPDNPRSKALLKYSSLQYFDA
ncbi:MAG: hypothetical protein IJH71_00280 [Eubacterium sp.]|nr:hypothetical protein [Eubacterium sp.]